MVTPHHTPNPSILKQEDLSESSESEQLLMFLSSEKEQTEVSLY